MHIDFTTLNRYVTVMYLRLIRNTSFYVVTHKNLKWLHFSLLFILVYKMCRFSGKKSSVSKTK